MTTVSCVLTTYNRADRLPGAIKSIQDQTHEDLEILVVDDGSTDETPEVIDQYTADDDRIVPLRADKGTPMGARNVGIEAASGEYIAFLDDDDRWRPRKLEKQLPYADEYSLVSCSCRFVRPNETVTKNVEFSGLATRDLEDVFRGIRNLYPSGTLARAQRVYDIDGFDEEYIEWDFYMRMVLEHGPAAVLSEPLVDFNREDIKRVSEEAHGSQDLMDIYDRHKHRVSWRSRRHRLARIYRIRSAECDAVGPRLTAYGKAVYYDPRILVPRFRHAAVRTLEATRLKEPLKRVLTQLGVRDR